MKNATIWAYFIKPKKRTLKEIIRIMMAKWARFNKITQRAEKTKKKTKNIKLNFTNAKYSVGGTYYFPYSFETATKIVKSAIYFDSVFSFLQSHMFIKDLNLNLYRCNADYEEANDLSELDFTFEILFEESDFNATDLTQEEYFKTLKIHDWPYSEFVTSATFFYLHNLYLKYSKLNPAVPVFSDLKGAAGFIAQLILSPTFGDNIFQTIKQTNLFIKFPFECLFGFSSFIQSECLMNMYEIENCKSLCSRIEYTFQGDFSRLKYYLSAFNFMIPYSLIKYINAYCIETQSISLIYYTLKQYQNILDPELTDNDKSLENFVLSKFLHKEMALLNTVGLPNSSQLQLFLMGTSLLLLQNSILLTAGGFINPVNPESLRQIMLENKKNPQTPKALDAQIRGLRGKNLDSEYQKKGWMTVARPSGLIIAEKNNIRSVIGNTGTFELIKAQLKASKNILSSGSEIPYEVDHYNWTAFRTFGEINTLEGYATCSPREFNRTRYISKEGLNLGSYDDWKSLRFSDFVYKQQKKSFKGAWELYETRSNCTAERQLLDSLGLLDMLPNFYSEGEYLALAEMRQIADIFNLGNGPDATLGTYLIPSLLAQIDYLTDQLEKKTEYKSTKNQIPLDVVIRDIFQYRWNLVVAINSLKSVVEPRGQNDYNTYITKKLAVCDSKLDLAATLCVNTYSSCFKSRGLAAQNTDQLKSDINQQFQRKFTSADRLKDIEELWILPQYQELNIGEFNSRQNLTKLNLANNKEAFPQICNELNLGFSLPESWQRETNEANSRLVEDFAYFQKQEAQQKQIEEAKKQQRKEIENRTSREKSATNIAATTGSENNFDVNPKVKPSTSEKAVFQEPKNIETSKEGLDPIFFENDDEWLNDLENFKQNWMDRKLQQNQKNIQEENIQDEHPQRTEDEQLVEISKQDKQTDQQTSFPKSPGQEYLKETGRADWKVSQDEFNCDDESNCDNVDE